MLLIDVMLKYTMLCVSECKQMDDPETTQDCKQLSAHAKKYQIMIYDFYLSCRCFKCRQIEKFGNGSMVAQGSAT